MQESFLHYIWQHQYYEKSNLRTTTGASLQILTPGNLNFQDGPDFRHAKILIDQIQWVGPVELHLKSSQWYQHRHQSDPAYDQVILHVVWEDDKPVYLAQRSRRLPTLSLAGRISKSLLVPFRKWDPVHKIPCHPMLRPRHQPYWRSMLQLCLDQRLKQKRDAVLRYNKYSAGDWDATTYHLINLSFGFKKNSWGFAQLSTLVPLLVVRKLIHRPIALEALFFGQAGLLPTGYLDKYSRRLSQEYHYLKRRFHQLPAPLQASQWRFLRTRPSSFPTIRLAQLIEVHKKQAYRWDHFRKPEWMDDIKPLLQFKLPDYWQHHYHFTKVSKPHTIRPNKNLYHHLILNAVIPLRLAYFSAHGQAGELNDLRVLLNSIPCEQNGLVKHWKKIGFNLTSAYHSQALIHLDQVYCSHKRCLQCQLGMSLLKGK